MPTPIYTFASIPDFMNADIGDVSGRPNWTGGYNSTNASYERAVDAVLSNLASHNPDDVYVAGDLVEGHWGQDIDNTKIFGPCDTDDNRREAIRKAGNFYYSEWKKYFTRNGININNVYPAVGDHEIGDNGWPIDSFKFKNIPTFKDTFADNFIKGRFTRRPFGTPFEDTSYITTLAGGRVVLLSLDVFAKWEDGVHATVVGGHLDWVKKVLATTTPNQLVIVQGHTPVLGPVRLSGSSGLMLEGGKNSGLWQAMTEAGVDFYFAGEVHDNTVRTAASGPIQISHGGLIAYNSSRYMIGKWYDDGSIIFQTYRFPNAWSDRDNRMWQTSDRRPPIKVVYPDPPYVAGGMKVQNGQIVYAVGDMQPNNVDVPPPPMDQSLIAW